MIHDKNCWDAQTYDEVSRLVQYRWGQQILEWRKWNGDESVMDAGCGSGLISKLLAQKVPRGKVYAVDVDSNMIRQAKRNLKGLENVELVEADFAQVKLPTKLDVIFSNAALHWVHDHAQVFQHFWDMLNCDETKGGQLLIQCGGCGNLQRILAILRRVMEFNEFKEYFASFNQSWYFAKPDDTSKLLGEIGYVSTKIHLHNDCVNLIDREIYSRFVKTVIMKPFLECLPDDKLRNRYLELFLQAVEKNSASISSNKSQTPWSLDYVRLNIIADKL
ncbi:MAG: class I SAM-dependent methyltransferase [Nitrososphaeraceae archaeon]